MAIINNLQKGQRLISETNQDNYLHDQLKQSYTGFFSYNFQIQFIYAPDTDAILILI